MDDLNKLRLRKAKELKELREQSRLSQDQLAVLSSLSHATISRMESGLQNWTLYCDFMYREGVRKYTEDNKTKRS